MNHLLSLFILATSILARPHNPQTTSVSGPQPSIQPYPRPSPNQAIQAITISFADDQTGKNFAVKIPVDNRSHDVQSLISTTPLLATSAQLIGFLPGTVCDINFGKVMFVLDDESTFVNLNTKPLDVKSALIHCTV